MHLAKYLIKIIFLLPLLTSSCNQNKKEGKISYQIINQQENKKEDKKNIEEKNEKPGLAALISNFPSDFNIKSFGINWNWDTDIPKDGITISGEGILSNHTFRIIGYISQTGNIYGRYYNSNSIQLDVNGFIKENGDIKIQLGHADETSFMNLYPQKSKSNGVDFPYFGEWGKNNKTVEITIKIGKEFIPDDMPTFISNSENEKSYQAELESRFNNSTKDRNEDNKEIENAILGFNLYEAFKNNPYVSQYVPLGEEYYIRTVINNIHYSNDSDFKYVLNCEYSHIRLYSNSDKFRELSYPIEIVFKGILDRFIDGELVFTYVIPLRAY